MARIVIYSDQPILNKGLECVIAQDSRLNLDACCTNLPALRQLLGGSPHLAVLDLTPQITADELNQLQFLAPECKLILWTDSIAADFAMRALTIGVRGVLRKTLPPDAHLQCLQRVLAGDLWFEKRLTDSFRTARRVPLTRRESQLITLLSRGLKNKEISCELGISEGTVKVYLSHLFHKSGVRDRFELAMRGMQNLSLAGANPGDHAGLRSLSLEPVRHA
ncbi:MAG TPA: response regulator transcription factor [Bryobacteraceae bacterium]|nr:response regulator transcription factor [Bryobacteraceae bacterium]